MKNKLYIANTSNMHITKTRLNILVAKTNKNFTVKEDWIWMTDLAPSQSTFEYYLRSKYDRTWNVKKFKTEYTRRYCNDLRNIRTLHALNALADMLEQESVTIICHCKNLNLCHTQFIGKIMERRGFEIYYL